MNPRSGTATMRILLSAAFALCMGVAAPAAAQEWGLLFVEAPTLHPIFVRFPEGFQRTRPVSVILALHGRGDTPENFAAALTEVTEQGHLLAVLRAPYVFPIEQQDPGDPRTFGFDWNVSYLRQPAVTAQASESSVEYVLAAIEGLHRSYNVERLVLLGFSQGGGMAYRFLGRYPEAMDGVVVLGTGLPEGWLPEGESGAGLQRVPVYIGQGRADAPARAEAARDTLTARGYAVTFRTYDAGHVIPRETVRDALAWIERLK